MARYNANRTPYDKQDLLLNLLCEALMELKTKNTMRDFIKDLMSRDERMMLVRRLQIAQRLLAKRTYDGIRAELGVGNSTIARVDRWLHFGRNGYKRAIEKLRKPVSAR